MSFNNKLQPSELLSPRQSALWSLAAIVSFHLAYEFSVLSFLIGVYLFSLVQLARIPTPGRAFCIGWLTGLFIFAPQLMFFFHLFGPFGAMLWLVGSFWTALFVLLAHSALARFGAKVGLPLVAFLWMGLEYFRCELYPLKFTWLVPGYTFAGHEQPLLIQYVGIYGVGFLLVFAAAMLSLSKRWLAPGVGCVLLVMLANLARGPELPAVPDPRDPMFARVQMEFPSKSKVIEALNATIKRYPETQVVVLSEYTFDGSVPASVLSWCRQNERYLVAGGKDFLSDPSGEYYNTAFVVSPEGKIVFQQAKIVPIQFFADGLPAKEQRLWDSPWGKIGICICYDLSYSRVTDELVRQGAQMLIVPTMDVESWGRHEHELHSKVAPSRAAEYHIPIVRVCSSGISQMVGRRGQVIASLPYPGQKESFAGKVHLAEQGKIPPDRYLAPVAVLITVVFIAYLLFLSLRNHFFASNNSTPSQTEKLPCSDSSSFAS